MPDVTVFSAQGIWIVVTQFLIGVAMGFTMQIVFAAVGAAGDFIGLSMGPASPPSSIRTRAARRPRWAAS